MSAAEATVMTPPATPVTSRLRREARTTPGRLRLFSLIVAVLLVLTGLAAYGAVARRTSGVRTVANSEPLIVDAQALNAALAEADATAANAFLAGGIEPADQRALYQQDIAKASKLLVDAAQRDTAAQRAAANDAEAPLKTLASQLPVYTGLVDTARANNRQGFPVGAAYLRQASRVMAGDLLPAAQRFQNIHDARLQRGSHRARSALDTSLVALAMVVVLVGMIWVQVWLFKHTNRVFNIPLVFATLLVVVLLALVGANLGGQAAKSATARDRSYASVSLLAQARTVAFKAKGDESLTLIARGNGGAFDADFNTQVAKLPSLLSDAKTASVSALEHDTVSQAESALRGYLAVHKNIRRLDDSGQFDQAVGLAVGGGTASPANRAFTDFEQKLSTALNASQADFVAQSSAAQRHLRNLTIATILVVLVAALLSLWGFQQRINEYR